MIIFGTRTMQSVRSTGIFNCPRCGQPRHYQYKSVNRWFTLYFIPVIPLGSMGTYIQCGQCGATYTEAVLSYDPEAERQQLYLKLRGLLVLVAVADGTPADADEICAIGRAYQEAAGAPLAAAAIESDVQRALTGKIQLGAYARQAGAATELPREGLVPACGVPCSLRQGAAASDAGAVVTTIAQAMQITTEQVKQILG